jgi:hypothetical protein
MIGATALWPGTTGETSMSALEDATVSGPGQRQPHARKSTWKGVLLVLGALTAVSWVFNVYDQLTSKPANQAQPVAEAVPTGEPLTLASALRDYKTADAACEKAAGGLERNSGTLQSALDACGDSLRAVSDLPALYGPQAAALESCIDMEGARYSGLNMILAMREHRGDPMQDKMDEGRYRQSFHLASLRCNAALVTIQRAMSATQ